MDEKEKDYTLYLIIVVDRKENVITHIEVKAGLTLAKEWGGQLNASANHPGSRGSVFICPVTTVGAVDGNTLVRMSYEERGRRGILRSKIETAWE